MKLSLLLDPRLILIGVPCDDYAAAMRAMLEPIRLTYSFEVSAEAMEAALLRPGETCEDRIENGIAVTRANIPNLPDLIVSVLIPAAPVTAREGAVKLFVLLLSGSETADQSLKIGEAFIRIAADRAVMNDVLASPDGRRLVAVLDQADITVPAELTVTTIMTREAVTVGPDTPLRELLTLFRNRNISFVPVADGHGKFLGEIHLEDILRHGLPDYAFQIGNLNFLSSFQPFTELLGKGLELTARHLMKDPPYHITPETALAEAVFELVSHHSRSAAVIDHGHIAGVVSTTDILRKVFNL